jgi:hypothetical protein
MTIREAVIKRLEESGLSSYLGRRAEIPKSLYTQIAQDVYRDVAPSVAKDGATLMERIDKEMEGHGYTIPGERNKTLIY